MRDFAKTIALVAAMALPFSIPAAAVDIKVGFLGPLSGSAAVYGSESLAGAEMALASVNASLAADGHKIILIPADTTANPGTAAQAAQRMVDVDQVMAILGGATSAETAAAIEVTRAAKVLQLSPLSQDSTLTAQGNPWFARIAQNASVFGVDAAKWLLQEKHGKQVYLMVRNDNGNQSVAEAFAATAKDLGVPLAGRVVYEPSAKDFKPFLAKMMESKPGFLVVLGLYTDTGLILKQMAEMQIKLPAYANTSPAIPQLRDIAGPGANGAYGGIYYLAGSIDTPSGRAFLEQWQAKYKRLPSQYEGMGYDAMQVLGEAIKLASKAGKLTREGVRDALLTIADFPGATGPITMLKNGDVKRPLPFVQLQGSELKLDYLMK